MTISEVQYFVVEFPVLGARLLKLLFGYKKSQTLFGHGKVFLHMNKVTMYVNLRTEVLAPAIKKY